MPRLLTLLAILICSLALAACGDDGEDSTTAAGGAATEEAEQAAEGAGCKEVEEPEPKGEQNLREPREQLDDAKQWEAVVKTNCGEFTIALDVKRAPETASSFAYLARDGFYDDLVFHRIVSVFVIQGGDPLGTGQGGPGYSIVEAPPDDLQYTRGVVAMAKTELEEPGTSGSQFFVVTGEDAGLEPLYALVGEVSDGQDVVDRIGALQTDQTERPIEPVVIESVEIREQAG